MKYVLNALVCCKKRACCNINTRLSPRSPTSLETELEDAMINLYSNCPVSNGKHTGLSQLELFVMEVTGAPASIFSTSAHAWPSASMLHSSWRMIGYGFGKYKICQGAVPDTGCLRAVFLLLHHEHMWIDISFFFFSVLWDPYPCF